MNSPMISFFRKLDLIPAGADQYELREMLDSWRLGIGAALIRRELFQWLSESAQLDRLAAEARETATHYVWPLYAASSGHRLVVNEFKDPQQINMGYATTVHNHRYSFASLVLSGGYVQVRSEVEMPWPGEALRVREIGRDQVAEGSIMAVNHDEFHQLVNLANSTLTLLVKSPAVKTGSISVNTCTMKVSMHVPVESRVCTLMNVLAKVSDANMAEVNSGAGPA